MDFAAVSYYKYMKLRGYLHVTRVAERDALT